jgi:hypothetical protein
MHRVILILLLISPLTVLSANLGPLGADPNPAPNPWSTAEIVSPESDAPSFYPDIAVDDEGTVHVIWNEEGEYLESGDDLDVFYRSRTRSGEWSSIELLSDGSDEGSTHSTIAVDGEGTVHAVWTENRRQGMFDFGMIVYRNKPRGGHWSPTDSIRPETDHRAWLPDMFCDRNGRLHLVWYDGSDYGGSGPDSDVLYMCRSEGGTWSPAELVSAESDEGSWTASVAVDSYGTVFVAWMEWADQGLGWLVLDILFKFKPSGGDWTDVENLSYSRENSWSPSLSVGPDDVLHLAWEDRVFEDGYNVAEMMIYCTRDPGGEWGPIEVLTLENPWLYSPTMVADDFGVVHIAWFGANRKTGWDYDVLYRKKLPGHRWTRPEIASMESDDSSDLASMVVDRRGTVHLVWADEGSYGGSGSDWDIFYKNRPLGPRE